MSVFPQDIHDQARALIQAAERAGVTIATAESCTGGLIAGCLTDVAGSSVAVDRAFVTYSNEAKTEMVGVPEALLIRHGAVSEEVACAMAEGALARANVGMTVAVTGVAGPGGGSEEKPVGLVHFACAMADGETEHMAHVLPGDRAAIRLETVRRALGMMLARLGEAS